MSITAAQLIAEVSVKGATEAKAQLEGVGQASEKSTGGFKNMLSGALSTAVGFGALSLASNAFSFVKDQLSAVFTESMNAQAGMAQRVARLKETGDAAGMTAQ